MFASRRMLGDSAVAHSVTLAICPVLSTELRWLFSLGGVDVVKCLRVTVSVGAVWRLEPFEVKGMLALWGVGSTTASARDSEPCGSECEAANTFGVKAGLAFWSDRSTIA